MWPFSFLQEVEAKCRAQFPSVFATLESILAYGVYRLTMKRRTDAADWANLPSEILHLIGSRLDVLPDQFHFRSVCKSWGSSLSPFPRPPWLLLPESKDTLPETKHLHGFIGFGDMEDVRDVYFPELDKKRCLGSKGTWLITFTTNLRPRQIRMLHLFSRTQLDLPPSLTYLRKIVLSSTPSVSLSPPGYCAKNCIAVLNTGYYRNQLELARPGDESWTALEDIPYSVRRVADIIFYKEKFYAVDENAIVFTVYNFGDDLGSAKASILARLPLRLEDDMVPYLVEWMGELVTVVRSAVSKEVVEKDKSIDLYKTQKFEVYKVIVEENRCEKLTSLGEHSLFLGYNNSVSVLASNYCGSVKKNCIYFTDDFAPSGSCDMGVFDMGDKSIQFWPHHRGRPETYYTPPIWIIPTRETNSRGEESNSSRMHIAS